MEYDIIYSLAYFLIQVSFSTPFPAGIERDHDHEMG